MEQAIAVVTSLCDLPLVAERRASTVRRGTSRGWDVGEFEVAALEEKRFSRGFGQGVGEAVSEVQSCGVVALAESPPDLSRRLRLFGGDRVQFDLRPSQERIEFVASC